MQPGIDPRVDFAFKKVLSSPDLLVSFLNAVLEPPTNRRIQQVEILNPFQTQETDIDKLSVLDIKARDESGRMFNVEMQLLAEPFLRDRVLNYWSRLFEDQLQTGVEYDELCPTISVCVCDFVLFPQTSRHHLVFRLRETTEGIEFSDRIEIHTLELEKFLATDERLASDLDCWLYFFRNAAQLDAQHLPGKLNRRDFREAMGVLEMIQQNRYEHELYEARWKAQLDEKSRRKMYEQGLQKACEKAREEALAEGRAEGLAEGFVKALRIQVQELQQLLNLPQTTQDELNQLSKAELDHRIEELKAKFAVNTKRN